ncbi:MAG: HAD family hydrolase [Phycisphaeraceae bacterium JB051]
MKSVVFFDLDDTLVDHRHCNICGLKAMRLAYEVFGAVDLDALEQTYIRLIDQTHSKVLAGKIDLAQARSERFKQMFAEYGVTVNDDDAMVAADAYRAAYVEHRQPVPGAIELLKYLRPHVKIGIITNHIREEQVRKLDACNLWEHFDELVISGDIGINKPDPGIFEHALGLFDAKPQDCVMVGDSWHSDIGGAFNMGIKAVWLNRYDDPCPDPNMATEINSLTPTESVAKLLLA